MIRTNRLELVKHHLRAVPKRYVVAAAIVARVLTGCCLYRVAAAVARAVLPAFDVWGGGVLRVTKLPLYSSHVRYQKPRTPSAIERYQAECNEGSPPKGALSAYV